MLTRRVTRTINHAGYDASTMENDISLLFFDEPVWYTPMRRVDGPGGWATSVGTSVTVAGWGRLTDGGVTSDAAMSVDVDVFDQVSPTDLAWAAEDHSPLAASLGCLLGCPPPRNCLLPHWRVLLNGNQWQSIACCLTGECSSMLLIASECS